MFALFSTAAFAVDIYNGVLLLVADIQSDFPPFPDCFSLCRYCFSDLKQYFSRLRAAVHDGSVLFFGDHGRNDFSQQLFLDLSLFRVLPSGKADQFQSW